MAGLRTFLSEEEGTAYLEDGKVDPGTMDAIASDAVVQYAVFGEVEYG